MSDSQLSTIFTSDREFKISDKETVKIKEIKLKDIPVVIGIIKKIFGFKLEKNQSQALAIAEAVEKDFDSVKKLIEITTDLTASQIDELNAAGTISILKEVVKDNMDFLVKKVIPLVNGLTETVKVAAANGSNKSKN